MAMKFIEKLMTFPLRLTRPNIINENNINKNKYMLQYKFSTLRLTLFRPVSFLYAKYTNKSTREKRDI